MKQVSKPKSNTKQNMRHQTVKKIEERENAGGFSFFSFSPFQQSGVLFPRKCTVAGAVGLEQGFQQPQRVEAVLWLNESQAPVSLLVRASSG
jgi:hypothetical protein